jgi:hypothetical protein
METKAIIYQGELDYIARCVMDYPEIETGGDLFGFWTYSGFPVIQYVIGPGPKANHQVAFFNQDENWLENSGKLLRASHGLQHIGQWHSHHRLGLAEPSSHDVSTIVRAIGLYNLKQFLLVITNIREAVTVNGFLFRKEWGSQIDHSSWVVLEGPSPVRKSFDNRYKSAVYKPGKKRAALSALYSSGLDEMTLVKPDYRVEYWLSKKENHKELKKIMDSLSVEYSEVRLFMNDEDKTVFLEFEANHEKVRVGFPNDFPFVPPRFINSHNEKEVKWEYKEDFVEETLSYIKKKTIR